LENPKEEGKEREKEKMIKEDGKDNTKI